jgi:hypothetical protein
MISLLFGCDVEKQSSHYFIMSSVTVTLSSPFFAPTATATGRATASARPSPPTKSLSSSSTSTTDSFSLAYLLQLKSNADPFHRIPSLVRPAGRALQDILDEVDIELPEDFVSPLTSSESGTSKSKNVSFDLEKNQEYAKVEVTGTVSMDTDEVSQDPADEVSSLCYGRDDIQEFKTDKMDRAKAIRAAKDSTYSLVMTRAYNSCCKAAAAEDDTCTPLTGPERLYMMMQYRQDEVVGMETTAIQQVSKDRSARRRKLNVKILLAQETHASQEQIRAQSEQISLPSRLFARELGVAVESALGTAKSLVSC